jgi:hypothetical protein
VGASGLPDRRAARGPVALTAVAGSVSRVHPVDPSPAPSEARAVCQEQPDRAARQRAAQRCLLTAARSEATPRRPTL